jgi:N-acetylglucosamine-6-phosphate deacetylase
MICAIHNGKVISDNKIHSDLSVYFENGKIIAVTSEKLSCDREIDAKGSYVAPGFIDIHVHGGAGYEFVDATRDAVVNAANIHAKNGTTTIYPTISAYDTEKTENANVTRRPDRSPCTGMKE